MEENGNGRQFVLKKAYEISYAIFRIGSRIANTPLKEHLERQALSLLDAATVENYAWISMVSKAIEYLVKFGSDVGLINPANLDTIVLQSRQLNGAVAGLSGKANPAIAEEVPLADIFAGPEPLFSERQYKKNAATENPATKESGNDGHYNNAAILNPAIAAPGIRQSAIIEKIRQSGNCHLKDIQELLPDCSERTIRYDLQTLVEQNILERVGSGGPSVFYRIRPGIAG